MHAHTVNLVVVCSASLLNSFTCEKDLFEMKKVFNGSQTTKKVQNDVRIFESNFGVKILASFDVRTAFSC